MNKTIILGGGGLPWIYPIILIIIAVITLIIIRKEKELSKK